MKLPNGDRAIVEEAKLLNYCMSTTHPRGKHKARLFDAALGFTRHHAILPRSELLKAASTVDAVATHRNDFGQLYEVEFYV